MKDNTILTISSLLTSLLTVFHITSDAALGIDKANLGMLVVVAPIIVVSLYATLILTGRRSSYIIIMLGSLLGLAVAYLHMSSPRIADRAMASGGYFFVWTLLAMGVTSLFSIVLSARGLWMLNRTKAA